MNYAIQLKRARDAVGEADGTRVLVDGVWPRGISKADAQVDRWLRELAPSKSLRQWFGHDPKRWEEFRRCYRDELGQVPQALRELLELCRSGRVTLVFGARDREHNQAVALREVLIAELEEAGRPSEPASPVCYDSSQHGEQ